MQLLHDCTRMDVEVPGHPVIVVNVGTERVHVLAAENVDQELPSLFEIGHGYPDVIHAGKSGNGHFRLTS
jgi:hypothetical protein